MVLMNEFLVELQFKSKLDNWMVAGGRWALFAVVPNYWLLTTSVPPNPSLYSLTQENHYNKPYQVFWYNDDVIMSGTPWKTKMVWVVSAQDQTQGKDNVRIPHLGYVIFIFCTLLIDELTEQYELQVASALPRSPIQLHYDQPRYEKSLGTWKMNHSWRNMWGAFNR